MIDLAAVPLEALVAEVERRRVAAVVAALRGVASSTGPTWLGRRDVPAGTWPAIRDAIKHGEIRAARVGRNLLISREEFDRFMLARAGEHAAELAPVVDSDDPIEAAIKSGKLRRIGGAR